MRVLNCKLFMMIILWSYHDIAFLQKCSREEIEEDEPGTEHTAGQMVQISIRHALVLG